VSDIMTQGIIRMPYEMAMEGEISRKQFYDRAQKVLDENEALRTQLAEARKDADDAKRYRYLSDEYLYSHGTDREVGCVTQEDSETWVFGKDLAVKIDKAIHALIDKEQEGGKG
jgi:hypothetical protein